MEQILIKMTDLFPSLLNLHVTVSVVIVFVLCARIIMRKAPKIFSYVLWGIVLLRLLVPVSLESPLSIVPERTKVSSMVEINDTLPSITFETSSDAVQNQWQKDNQSSDEVFIESYSVLKPQGYLTILWIAGIGIMLVWSGTSYIKFRKQIQVAVAAEKGIYISDDIGSPFVIGLLRPKIYLPSSLLEKERRYVLLHEKHHIRRGDHIIRWLSWMALCIHWFNPLVWVAFVLSGKDMEMSCDEAVLKQLGTEIRADYSASLLSLAVGKRILAGTPLLFGESNTKGRIMNIARWKKPAVWVIVVCVAVCSVLAVCLLTDPEVPEPEKTIEFTDLNAAEVTAVTLQNAHNGIFTHIIDPDSIAGICDIIKSVYGSNGISGKGYYEGSYSVTLYNADEKIMSVGFGDTNSFFYGKGKDGYPIRYDLEGLSIDGVIRLLSEYDISGFDWNWKENASKWGVELYTENVTDSGLTAVFALSMDMLSSDFLEKNKLSVGEFYQIEKLENGSWVALEQRDAKSAASAGTEVKTPITNDSTGRISLDWADRYGRLGPGEYRIEMYITLVRDREVPETLPIYAEFSTVASLNEYGVSIRVYESDAEHLILTFHQEGDERDINFSRMNGFTLEKLEDGIWKHIDLEMDWGDTQVRIDFEDSNQPRNGLYLVWDHLGKLQPGAYRVGQQILTGIGESFTVYDEFYVTGVEETGQ